MFTTFGNLSGGLIRAVQALTAAVRDCPSRAALDTRPKLFNSLGLLKITPMKSFMG
jgi:hypothetical protein